MSNVLEVTDRGHVRVLRLNRPEKKNALSQELAWGIVHAVEQAAHDENVWVIGITGIRSTRNCERGRGRDATCEHQD